MIRFAEAALQVRGQAGEHQVDGARRALGHAYGGGSQFFSMWLVGAEPPAVLTRPVPRVPLPALTVACRGTVGPMARLAADDEPGGARTWPRA